MLGNDHPAILIQLRNDLCYSLIIEMLQYLANEDHSSGWEFLRNNR